MFQWMPMTLTAKKTFLVILILLAAAFASMSILPGSFFNGHATMVTGTLLKFVGRPADRFSALTRSSTPTPRVMCMIFTTPGKWTKRGVAVMNTWSRHCHRRRFFYSRLKSSNASADIEKFPETVAQNVTDGRRYLTAKVMNALEYSYRIYGNDTDWYLKADDDTYVIWPNLIGYLRGLNASETSYLGCWFTGRLPRGYNSGGAGYLLSRGSARRVMTEGAIKFPRNCKMNGTSSWEDVDMGDCLRALGIYPTDTRDALKRLRFHSESPLRFLKGILGEGDNKLARYFWAERNGVKFGDSGKAKSEQMLSNESISFHYVSPAEMIFIDSLLDTKNGVVSGVSNTELISSGIPNRA